MQSLGKIFLSYVKSRLKLIIVFLITLGIFLTVLFLYSLPLEAVGYGAILAGVFLLLAASGDFYIFLKKYRALKTIHKSIGFEEPTFPAAKDMVEE